MDPRSSMRKRPEPHLVLCDLPQSGEPVRFDDQEEHDQGAEDHQLDVRKDGVRDFDAEQVRDAAEQQAEEDRQQDDERRAEEGAEDRAHAAEDDHKENAKRQVEVECLGLHRPQVAEGVQRRPRRSKTN